MGSKNSYLYYPYFANLKEACKMVSNLDNLMSSRVGIEAKSFKIIKTGISVRLSSLGKRGISERNECYKDF